MSINREEQEHRKEDLFREVFWINNNIFSNRNAHKVEKVIDNHFLFAGIHHLFQCYAADDSFYHLNLHAWIFKNQVYYNNVLGWSVN